MKKIIIGSALALSLGMFLNLQAKECYNANTIDVKWVSYKTMAKIGVGGNFSQINLHIQNTNTSTLKAMLEGATVDLNLKHLDAHMTLKNSNIVKFFTSGLGDKKISTKIISVDEKSLSIEITLNKITQTIPMKYSLKDSHILATGVIDALDFNLVPALRVLNKNVSGHKNKGWNDISISFNMPYNTKCQ